MELTFIVDERSISFTNGMIIWDPVSNKIVGVDTYADGGMTRYEIDRQGKTLTLTAVGAKADGTSTSANFTFTVVSPDQRTIDVTNRTEGGQSLPDIPAVEIRRVKRKKRDQSPE
jgi:hypothetical protein